MAETTRRSARSTPSERDVELTHVISAVLPCRPNRESRYEEEEDEEDMLERDAWMDMVEG